MALFVNPLLFAYREAPQEATEFSPFELLCGGAVRRPVQILKELWTRETDGTEIKTSYQYVFELRERLNNTMKIALEELLKSRKKNKTLYDRKTKRREFQEGDKVLLLLPTDTNKLLMHWKGPYEIMSRCGKGNDYRIKVNKKVKTFHANMLKKYIERAGQDRAPQQKSDDKHIISCDVCTKIIGGNEDLSVNDDEMMELANCHEKETVQDVKLGVKLTKTQQEEMMSTLSKHKKVFSDIPGKTNMIKHKIELTEKNPVRSRPYPLPYTMRANLKKEIKDMLSFGIIQESNSPFASFNCNYGEEGWIRSHLGSLSEIKQAQSRRSIAYDNSRRFIQRLGKSKYYSKIDLSKGYWQISVAEKNIEKTAFITPDGTYDFSRMPFGMKNSRATLVRGMRKIFAGANKVDRYINDLIVHTNDWQVHLQVLEELLRRLRITGLTAKPSKCVVEFLGHYIGHDWITINENNLEKIGTARKPTTKKEVRSFLGFADYYRAHIPTFAAVAAPLTDLTLKGQPNKLRWRKLKKRPLAACKTVC